MSSYYVLLRHRIFDCGVRAVRQAGRPHCEGLLQLKGKTAGEDLTETHNQPLFSECLTVWSVVLYIYHLD